MSKPKKIDPGKARMSRMKKNVLNSVRLHQDDMNHGGMRWRTAMLTLTYRNNDEYDPKDVSECLKRIRQYLKRRNIPFRYVWVLELQKRGAPHYHVILWLPWIKSLGTRGKAMKLPYPDALGWWTKGTSRIEWMRKNNPWYIAKYTSKMQKANESISAAWAFPKGARISGQGGLSETGRRDRRWWSAPLWVRKLSTIEDDIRPTKGGWFSRASGEFWETPWKILFSSGGVYIVLKETAC